MHLCVYACGHALQSGTAMAMAWDQAIEMAPLAAACSCAPQPMSGWSGWQLSCGVRVWGRPLARAQPNGQDNHPALRAVPDQLSGSWSDAIPQTNPTGQHSSPADPPISPPEQSSCTDLGATHLPALGKYILPAGQEGNRQLITPCMRLPDGEASGSMRLARCRQPGRPTGFGKC